MEAQRKDANQRVRIGLTGLACVFLLVLLGAILVKFVHDGEASRSPEPASQSAQMSSGGGLAENSADALPKEPLAELGIAPGNVPGKEEAAQAPPAPAPTHRN